MNAVQIRLSRLAVMVLLLLGATSAAVWPALAVGTTGSQIFVGDHLHTLSVLGHRTFVTGHESAGRSDDAGKSWTPTPSLKGADIMSWTSLPAAIFAGGHSGLFKSTDNGASFKRVKIIGPISDVHSIGSSGKSVYIGSPQAGFLMSTDAGTTWKIRNAKVGQGFMGSMLVDPKNPKRIIAPDMSAGLVTSQDGGLNWSNFGGPPGPMAVAWNSKNIQQIAVIGMMTSGVSLDGGKSWTELKVPAGSAAVAYSSDGKELIVGVLKGTKSQIYTSTNRGNTWVAPGKATPVKENIAMDPNMPGMDHSANTSTDRPVALTLGTFTVGTSAVFATAILMRRQDRAKLATKHSLRERKGTGK